MTITLDAQTIITAASVVTALGILLGAVIALYKRHEKMDKVANEVEQLKQEDCLICFALEACLDGLEQLGANHSVPVAREKLQKFLNQRAHDQTLK